jgi:FixJ family two-component response regulator
MMVGIDHEVVVLDDDTALLKSLEDLLKSNGFNVRMHSEAEDFFQVGLPKVPSCLLLDNHLGNGTSGVQVHQQILERGWFIPTIFLTGTWDVHLVVKVMRAGADGFLTKPFDSRQLLSEVKLALQLSMAGMTDQAKTAEARARSASLTPREREVVTLVARGCLNKEIADQLGLALITVKVHRARAMQKMGAGNPAELAHFAALAGLI